MRDQFAKCPDKKKKTLWQHVSERMVEQGFYFDSLSCEAKWRSLKKVYMYNKTRLVKKDGSKHIIIWAYYHDMDRAIKGISYEISGKIKSFLYCCLLIHLIIIHYYCFFKDIFNTDDAKECPINNCITTIGDYENTNSIGKYH